MVNHFIMDRSVVLTIKTQVKPPLQASKWLKYPVLLDEHEIQSLMNELGDFAMFIVSGVVQEGHETVSRQEFLECYAQYVNALRQGQLPDDPRIRPYFSSVWSVDLNPLYAFPVGENQRIVKVEKPVVQLQPHRFDYSAIDGKFRSMVYGVNSIHWGIQFSYPQIYQNDAMQIMKVVEGEEFPNTSLFKKLQRWGRQHTIATPFVIQASQEKVNVPIRIGKRCLEWINNHPQLGERGLSVQYTG